ncbi:protein-disulfide reductase DsbD domain-containing protein [Pedobacter sp. Leaf176]|uniref:protein-disulfide reductase DsbD domain-containing protein n=1 Tax=Pedobacter sp. Leaf176 TaxID=1736286 RepID=UPI0006FE70B2|nr:protein-disulfide reductase DsbD domain-containing protein [Pedobacter sp. Leaf176]KQR72426.1 sugar transporter [Pedobacter sp. Leaf176]
MKTLLFLAFFLYTSVLVKAQFKITSPVKWSYAASKIKNSKAVVYLKATIEDGWHIYAQNGVPKSLETSFIFSKANNYKIVGSTIEPKPDVKFEKALKANLSYFEKSVVFQQKVELSNTKAVVKGKLEFTVCNAKECRPAEELAFSIPVG